jgi:hypothetical protein
MLCDMLSNVTSGQMMIDKVIANADKTCAALHVTAWFIVAVNWAVSWWHDGPAPSGPLYYSAMRFIGRLDILVRANIEELTIKVGQTVSALLSTDPGACFTVVFGVLILLAGTLQWFLLGRLVQWVAARRGRILAVGVLGVYGAWSALAVFLWVAS